MDRYDIISRKGDKFVGSEWEYLPTVGVIGPMELEVRIKQDHEDAHTVYCVICQPEMRKEDCWNYTVFWPSEGGNLEPADSDVELDPYHMCLLYELHDKLTRDV